MGGERVTPEEAAALLAYVHIQEPYRAKHADAEQAAGTVTVWADTLAGVDPRWAMEYLRTAYRKVRSIPMTPGEVRQAWVTFRDRTTSEQEAAVRRAEAEAEPTPGMMPDWYRPAAAAAREAADTFRAESTLRPGSREWEQGMEDVTSRAVETARAGYAPGPTLVVDRYTEQRERSCHNPRCRCEHVKCRGGFYDLPEKVGFDKQVHRCATCAGYLRAE